MRKVEANSTRDSDEAGKGGGQPSQRRRSTGQLLLADESGQVLPWVVVMMVAALMVCALVIDVGHAMVVQRELQASADAAALAAAEGISGTSTTYQATGVDYSAGSGDENAYTGVSVGTPTITPLCLTTVSGWGIPCTTSGSSVTMPNAVSVTETASVPTLFAGIFGQPSVPVSATSTAAHARPQAYNIALIVDSTLSMAATDSNCGGITQMQCALNGIQQLLKGISTTYDYVSLFTFPNVQSGSPAGVAPTASSTFTCTSSPVPSSYQSVSYYNTGSQGMGYTPLLLPLTTQSPKYEPPWSSIAWAMPYTFPPIPTGTSGYTEPSGTEGPTYEVIPFKNDYNSISSSGSTSLNTSSTLVKAVGAVSGCGGIAPSSYDGNYGTYYAGALYAAQAALLSEQSSRSGSSNVIIILGDGDSDAPQSSDGVYLIPSSTSQATETYLNSTSLTTTAYTYPSTYKIATSGGTYPSWVDECQQSVTAAQYAATYSSNKTLVFTIAYGALTSGCPTDTTLKNPCTALQEMATQVSGETTSDYFYSDWAEGGGSASTGCKANTANSGVTAINDIYTAITAALTNARLIPNGTT